MAETVKIPASNKRAAARKTAASSIPIELVPEGHTKKIEFTKILISGIVLFSMGCITANYILAFRNATNINSEVTITLIGAVITSVVTYCLKSLGEKNSRNKYTAEMVRKGITKR